LPSGLAVISAAVVQTFILVIYGLFNNTTCNTDPTGGKVSSVQKSTNFLIN